MGIYTLAVLLGFCVAGILAGRADLQGSCKSCTHISNLKVKYLVELYNNQLMINEIFSSVEAARLKYILRRLEQGTGRGWDRK